jgi:CheY-like chemotaxis protein
MIKFNVLVVDDHPVLLRVFSLWLESLLGANSVTGVASGPEAMIWLKHNSPDLVVTDFQMPGMNGFELANHVNLKSAALPVVVMSFSNLSERLDKPAWLNVDQCMDKSTIFTNLPRFLEQRFGITLPTMPTMPSAPKAQPEFDDRFP